MALQHILVALVGFVVGVAGQVLRRMRALLHTDMPTWQRTLPTSCVCSCVFGQASAPDLTWLLETSSFRSASADGGRGIIADGEGGAIFTGSFTGTASFGTTTLTSPAGAASYAAAVPDVFVVRVNSTGDVVWAIQAGGDGSDEAYSIAPDGAGGALVTGSFKPSSNQGVYAASFGSTTLSFTGHCNGCSQGFVMRVDSAGTVLWAIQTGSYDVRNDPEIVPSEGRAIASDGTGGAFVAGSIGFTMLGDLFVMHVDGTGNVVWNIATSGVNAANGCGIAPDGVGGALVTGIWHINNAGGVFGNVSLPTTGGHREVFAARVTSSGAVEWAVGVGSDMHPYATMLADSSIASDGEGGAFVTAYLENTATYGATSLTSRGGRDIVVTRLDSTGSILWAAQAGGGQSDEGAGIVADGTGGALVTGSFAGTATFGTTVLAVVDGYNSPTTAMFVTRINSTGSFEWAIKQGASGKGFGYGIALDCAGGALITGRSHSKIAAMRISLPDAAASSSCDAYGNVAPLPTAPQPTAPQPTAPLPAVPLPAAVARVQVDAGAKINVRDGGVLVIG